MRILSINVGLPRVVEWNGRTSSTSIFKEPVEGPVSIDLLNLSEDRQADLTVRGSPEKAINAYYIAHYAYWRNEIRQDDWTPRLFGENLTTEFVLGIYFRWGQPFYELYNPGFHAIS